MQGVDFPILHAGSTHRFTAVAAWRVHTQTCSLGECYIGDSGAADLAEGLTHCVHLEKLE